VINRQNMLERPWTSASRALILATMADERNPPIVFDLTAVAEARVAIDRLIFPVVVLFLVETILTLGVFPDAAVNVRRLATAGIGLLLIGAQVAMIRPGLERICRDQWRAGAFVAFALLFFVAASVAIREGWAYRDQPDGQEVATLPSYFLSLCAVLAYPAARGLWSLRTIRAKFRRYSGDELVGPWLFGSRPARPSRGNAGRWTSRALPWFAICAICLAMTGLRLVHWRPLDHLPVLLPIGLGSACLVRGLRHVQPRASALRALDVRPPVLILRAFRDDGITAPGRDFEKLCVNPATWFRAPSFEELLAEEFDPVGPAVIVGAPGERLARLGASREYLATWEWREAVTRLIEEAALIVVIIGDTENLFWELRTVVARRGWDKVVLIVPPVANKQHLQERLRRFAEGNLDLLGPVLSARILEECTLLYTCCRHIPVILRSRKRAVWHYELAIRLSILLSDESELGLAGVRHFLADDEAVIENLESSRSPRAPRDAINWFASSGYSFI
jgi:hypothetical protein